MSTRASSSAPSIAWRPMPEKVLLPRWTPVALVLAALPLVQPNLVGPAFFPIGFLLILAAAAVALLHRPGAGPGEPATAAREPSTTALLIGCVTLGYVYVLCRLIPIDPVVGGWATLVGMIVTVGSLVAVAVVCRDPVSCRQLARGFVLILAVLCASWVVTALMWTVAGFDAGKVGTISTGQADTDLQTIYFPFTVTTQSSLVFDTFIPRFMGLGREPGWMAMYCGLGYFLAEMTGLRSRSVKLLLVAGLVGCISTAGFGAFVVTWAYHRFLRSRGDVGRIAVLRQALGLVMVGGALWLAVAAPVVGFAAKESVNQVSLDDRSDRTADGVRAFFEQPWGGFSDDPAGGINLIADVAQNGLPFVLLICAGLLLTIRSGTARFSNAVMVIVLITLLTSQPPKDSTWAFGVVVVACALREHGARAADQDGAVAEAVPTGRATRRMPDARLSLRRATADDLARIEGIGPALAARIVDHRARRGRFVTVEQLIEVPGIGPSRLRALRGRVRP